MLMPMTAEDIIVGIFCHLQQHRKTKLTADRETLHRAFFNAKVKFPKVMNIFTFRERELFPESNQLDQALSNLDAAGLISRQNLTPKYYKFEEPLERTYTKFSKEILDQAGILSDEIEKVTTEIEKTVYGEN